LDTITLKSLSYRAKHGYYSHERENGNEFELDVIARGEFKKAIENNDLNNTFNYESVDRIAAGVFNGPAQKLIETLCHSIGEKLFAEHPHVQSLTVSVRKLNPPLQTPARYAEITMEWKR
jgi:dihydroneopterin aldolase